MKKLLSLLLLINSSLFSQKKASDFDYLINKEDLKKHLSIIAADDYQGRETGKIGQQLTATYLVNYFKTLGVFAPKANNYNFEQSFSLIESVPSASLRLLNQDFSFRTHFFYLSAKRKVTLSNLPVHGEKSAKFLPATQEYILIVSLKGMDISAEISPIRKKLPANCKGIIVLTKNYASLYEYYEHQVNSSSMTLKDKEQKVEKPILLFDASTIVLPKQYAYLKDIKKKEKFKKANVLCVSSMQVNQEEKELISTNVLCFIEGSDSLLKNEIVVITAHYDHIGVDKGVVYNGADDDGTGTVALLELAEAFLTAKNKGHGSKRSILIMPVSGEEKGLLGSQYYSENPIYPLANTVTDLNIDMIGRTDIAHEGKPEYVYIIGSNMLSEDLHSANEIANKELNLLELDYRFNTKDDPNQFYYRSDHYNFAKNNIPSLFYFSGVHEDYHQPTDDIEKINFDKVEKVTRLVFHTAWIIANAPERPKLK